MAVADIMSSPFSLVLACFEYEFVGGGRIPQKPGVLPSLALFCQC
jgi:hypothetical protein